MNIYKFSEILKHKYKVAQTPGSDEFLEREIRETYIPALYNIPNKTHQILRTLANLNITSKSKKDDIVVAFNFCKNVYNKIDKLYKERNNLDLLDIEDEVSEIIDLINKNISPESVKVEGKVKNIQFPNVTTLIFEVSSSATRNDREARNQAMMKMRTGFSRILSTCVTILEKISGKPNIGRFKPQRAQLNTYDILPFIMKYDDEYSVNKDLWFRMVEQDPKAKEKITTIINAINRGHYPRDSKEIKEDFKKIKEDFELKNKTNEGTFHQESPKKMEQIFDRYTPELVGETVSFKNPIETQKALEKRKLEEEAKARKNIEESAQILRKLREQK
jgi:hypothetical protein